MIRTFAWLLLIHASTIAQVDTSFVAKLPYKGTIYSYINSKSNSISYASNSSNFALMYAPNSWGSIGIGGSYKWLDLSIGLLSYGKLNENQYGTTHRIDLQSHIYSRKYITDLFLQNYIGFYSTNKEVVATGEKAYIRKDIGMTHIGLNFLRIIDYKHYSTKAAFSSTEIQKKKAGTWAVGAKFNTFNIFSDSSLLSPKIDSLYQHDFKLKQFTSLLIGFMGGYMQNWLYKNWVFNATIMAGLANQLQYKELSYEFGKFYPHSTTGIIINARLGAGYNNDRSFFYFYIISDNCTYPLSGKYNLKHTFGRVDLCYGYRLFKE